MTSTYKLNDRVISITDTITDTTTYPMNFLAHNYSVQVTPTGGTCCVSVSNDGVNFVDWDSGYVSASTIDTCIPVQYLKVTLDTATSVDIGIWGV